ncbi:MAG TPA: hypothetical protein PLM96_05715 [Methanoregulaceae archaeon]|nr:hypothetical protein [Methanolinea sp.]MCC7566807.1 hypothetical protein [Methanoregulaceae archaeon]MDD3091199.1 hypothetical protein [Methanoregulaceae archaeon]MDD5049226.1 hypothetical protein [Methanoregulaceae archaeon]MDD5686147.1 hypothetical protein [Methanoregulaceae archaeon]
MKRGGLPCRVPGIGTADNPFCPVPPDRSTSGPNRIFGISCCNLKSICTDTRFQGDPA